MIEALKAQVPSFKSVSLTKQIDALATLFEHFTQERSRLGRLAYLDTPPLRNAYLRYHLPLNIARAACALEHVLKLHPRVGELTDVVDLGSGPATASLATLFTLDEFARKRHSAAASKSNPAAPDNPTVESTTAPNDHPVIARQYRLFDRSRNALRWGQGLMEYCIAGLATAPGETPAATVRHSVQTLPTLPQFTQPALVWLSMVINEISFGARRGPDSEDFLERLAGRLPEGSVVMILEPALRAPGRTLMRVHDEALASGAWRVLAPCTHQQDCPLLALRGDSWCHFRFGWNPPPFVRRVAQPLGLAKDDVAFSFLALERPAPGETSKGRQATENVARVIGDAMALRGGRRGIYVCQDGARTAVPLPRQRVRRGDRVRIEDGRRGKDVDIETRWE